MFSFGRTKKSPGWLAISLQEDGICVAHVVRSSSAKPAVRFVAFFPASTSSREETLKKIAKELNLSSYQCTTLLGAGEYQLLSLEAPNVPLDELKTATRWRLKDMLDFHVDDATIDVLDIPVDKSAAIRNHSMYAVAAKNQLIQQRQALFIENKIPLTVIDIPELAQRNIADLVAAEGRGLAFLSFDAHGGLLTMTYAGELYLSRRIEVTLEQLQQASEERRNALYDRITLELQRSLDHFDRQYHFITVAKMVLSGIGEMTSSLQAYLSSNIYVPVEVFDMESVFDISSTPDLQQAAARQRFFLTLGAALRHEEKSL